MTNTELRNIITKLQVVRDNARLPQYLDAEQAQAIKILKDTLERQEKDESRIVLTTEEWAKKYEGK